MPKAIPTSNPDLAPRVFRNQVNDLGFAYLSGSADCFIDLKHPAQGHYIKPVKHGRVMRLDATLGRLIEDRNARQKAASALAADRARKAEVAAAIAPAAMKAPRAPLFGDAAIIQLADDMRACESRSGATTDTDLVLLGWQQTQLKTYGNAARERAYADAGAA